MPFETVWPYISIIPRTHIYYICLKRNSIGFGYILINSMPILNARKLGRN